MPKSQSQSHSFRGFLDTTSELERIQNRGRTGDPSLQESDARRHATAWAPRDRRLRPWQRHVTITVPGAADAPMPTRHRIRIAWRDDR